MTASETVESKRFWDDANWVRAMEKESRGDISVQGTDLSTAASAVVASRKPE